MRDILFKSLLQRKTITLSEYARVHLGVKYSPSMEPMILATLAMDDRFEIKDGRISLTREAQDESLNRAYVVLDTETTGFTHYDNNVVEIAAMKVEGNRIISEFHTLINPGKPIDPGAIKVHGITDEMVAGSPQFQDIQADFLDFMSDSVFVAHNVNFDWNFMNSELKRNGSHPMQNQKMCTIQLTKTVVPGLPTYKLQYLTEYFQTKSDNTHRALDDVAATVEIMLQLLPKVSKTQLRKLIS